MYVYKIINKINKKCYIGITKSIKNRFNYHTQRYNKTSKKEYLEKPLYKAFRKYGIENFKFIILYEGLTIKEAKSKEIELIKKFKSLTHQNGYNITEGGDMPNSHGESVNTAKLTEQEVLEIRKRVSSGETIKSIYEDYKDKINYSGFQKTYNGTNWDYLGKCEKVLPSGASLDKDTVLYIRDLYDNQGMNPKQISEKLNLEYKKCWRICKRETYKNV